MKVIQIYTLSLNIMKKKFIESQEIYDDKKNSKKCLHFLEDGASDVQVGDVEQETTCNLFKI